jgi:putative flippase GtrA
MKIAQRFFTYSVVGTVAAACHYSLLILQVETLHIEPLTASTFAFIAGVVTSYALNSSITFRDRRSTSWPLAKFLIISSIGLGLNSLFMATILRIFNVHYLVAQAVATAMVLLWNFSGNFLWAFANRS